MQPQPLLLQRPARPTVPTCHVLGRASLARFLARLLGSRRERRRSRDSQERGSPLLVFLPPGKPHACLHAYTTWSQQATAATHDLPDTGARDALAPCRPPTPTEPRALTLARESARLGQATYQFPTRTFGKIFSTTLAPSLRRGNRASSTARQPGHPLSTGTVTSGPRLLPENTAAGWQHPLAAASSSISSSSSSTAEQQP